MKFGNSAYVVDLVHRLVVVGVSAGCQEGRLAVPSVVGRLVTLWSSASRMSQRAISLMQCVPVMGGDAEDSKVGNAVSRPTFEKLEEYIGS